MSLFYDLTFRGTIRSLNWAVVTHWRVASTSGTPTELEICQTLAAMGADFWDTIGKDLVTGNVNLTKVLATAFGDPTGFAELGVSIAGTLTGQACPEFTAKGWRQFRSNADFRTSTHRFPEVREDNNDGGSWTYDPAITVADTTAVSEFLGNPQTQVIDGGVLTITFQPVLIRKQYTTYLEPGHVPVVTYLDPPEISDVASAGFYGVTSQVSRKYILPA